MTPQPDILTTFFSLTIICLLTIIILMIITTINGINFGSNIMTIFLTLFLIINYGHLIGQLAREASSDIRLNHSIPYD